MKSTKQTAVHWLLARLSNLPSRFIDDSENYEKLFEQAIAMEKEQIENAVNLPREHRWYNALLYTNSGEQYYDKTYGE